MDATPEETKKILTAYASWVGVTLLREGFRNGLGLTNNVDKVIRAGLDSHSLPITTAEILKLAEDGRTPN